MQQQRLDQEGLTMLFCEVEAIINDRPITTVSNDAGDLEPLTPNHLLLLKSKPFLLPGVFNPSDCYGRRRWRQVQYMADLFWKRWLKEYLPELWTKKNGPRKEGILLQETLSSSLMTLLQETHGLWDKLLKSPDSKVFIRQVQMKTSTLRRPITKLVLLYEAQNGL